MNEKYYTVGELAKIAQVTAKTLHFYEKKGLLVPSLVSESNYRYYSFNDIEKLQLILALKLFGFSLNDIKYLMKSKFATLQESLISQLELINSKIESLNHIKSALVSIKDKEPKINDLITIFKVIKMNNQTNTWLRGNYSEEALTNLDNRNFTMDDQIEVTNKWNQLFADARNAMNNNADESIKLQLKQRYNDLIYSFTQGNSELQEGLSQVWSRIDEAPQEMKNFYSENKDVMEYINS